MTRQAFTPREYQQPVIDHILDVQRDAVWAGMGMGKTVSALTALDILEITEPGPALVLAPLRVAASTWPDEAKKWAHLRNVEVSAVVGTPEERRAALKRPATIYATNYDKCVAAFNIVTGHGLTEAEGWLLLQILKDVRQWQRPGFHQDSADDCIAYAALKAEAKMKEAHCNGR